MFRHPAKNIFIGVLASVVLFFPIAAALAGATDDLPGVDDFNIDKLGSMVTGIACWLIQIILAVMVIALVIAGVRFFLAHGNPTKVADAKKNFTWVLAGIAVVLATNIIIATVAYVVSGDEDYQYNPLDCGIITRDIDLA